MWWCSVTLLASYAGGRGVQFPDPPTLEKSSKGICLRNLFQSTQPNDREIVIEGQMRRVSVKEKHNFFFQKNTNFYLQQLRKKNKLSNIYVLFSALEEESVGCFAHQSRRARCTACASVHSSSQCLHTRGKRALGTTQCASRQLALNITINLAITKMICKDLESSM